VQIKPRLFIASVFSGFLLTLSFPKWGWDVLIWVALVPLLWAIRDQHPRQSFVYGVTAGLVHYMTLIYWVCHVVTLYGELSWLTAIGLLLLFSCYLSLFPAVFCATVSYIKKQSVLPLLATAPFMWVSLELIRSNFLSGFPWELLGHALYRRLHLIQVCDLMGVYGVSLFIVAINVVFYHMMFESASWKRKLVSKETITALAMLALVWSYGEARLHRVRSITSSANPIPVVLVQGNIDQSLKWNPKYQEKTIDIYKDLTQKAVQGKVPALIVWPETALPFYYGIDKTLTKLVTEFMQDTSAYFLFGSPAVEYIEGTYHYRNRAYLVSPDGNVVDYYDKYHLVPYGEYIPLKRWFSFLEKLVEPIGDFTPGEKGKTLHYPGAVLGPLICYESIFSCLSRSQVQNGADLLVNLTNDAWFGKTSAPYQHLSMLVFRVIENRRYAVRAANTGISGIINATGNIEQQSPLFEPYVLQGSVCRLTETTVYTQFGDLLAYGSSLWALGLLLWALFTKRRS
jgi:apolipoprotein N-acyltransferase